MPKAKTIDDGASIGKRKGAELRDPLERAGRASKDEAARFLSLVAKGVKYSDFMEHVAVNVFEELRSVSLVDSFFALDDAAVCAKLRMSKEQLQGYREHPQYEPVKEALRASAKQLGGASTVDGMAEAMERNVAHEVYGMAMLAGSDRERLKALDAFVDRRSAKKGREPEKGSALVIPERLLELMAKGLEMEKHLVGPAVRQIGEGPVIDLAVEQDDEISADVLNVPLQEEET